MALTNRIALKIQQFILVWPGDEQCVFESDGIRIVLPAYNEVSEPGIGKPFTHQPARNARGFAIPGTVVIENRYRDLPGGGKEQVWDAYACCQWIPAQRDDLVNQGLGIVQNASDVEEVMKAGREVWEEAQYEKAGSIIQLEQARRQEYKQKGQEAPPLAGNFQRRLEWALEVRKKAAPSRPQIPDDVLSAAVRGAPIPATAETVESLPAGALTGQQVYEAAKEVGLRLTKDELSGLLADDEVVKHDVQEQITEKRKAQEAEAAQAAEATPAS